MPNSQRDLSQSDDARRAELAASGFKYTDEMWDYICKVRSATQQIRRDLQLVADEIARVRLSAETLE
jgi:hypothetical protein